VGVSGFAHLIRLRICDQCKAAPGRVDLALAAVDAPAVRAGLPPVPPVGRTPAGGHRFVVLPVPVPWPKFPPLGSLPKARRGRARSQAVTLSGTCAEEGPGGPGALSPTPDRRGP
jgi:hypothetical protein